MIEGLIPSAGSTSATTPSSAQSPLGKEDFLQLLVAQLSAQDPLNPMDSREFSAQLAQFSALEQMTNVNSTLEELVAANRLCLQRGNDSQDCDPRCRGCLL